MALRLTLEYATIASASYTKKKFGNVKEAFVHRLNEMTVYILEVVSTNPNSPRRNARMLEV